MRIVVAPDSFKECLSALEVSEAIAVGVRRAVPDAELRLVPIADGGQGTVEALVKATSGRFLSATVTGPLGQPVEAGYGLLGDGSTAVLEMAAASGLQLVPIGERDPLRASTIGVGQLILAALDAGAKRILLGIGGSATNDGGAGMAHALGYRLLDRHGNSIPPGGGALDQLDRIDPAAVDPRVRSTPFQVACDVTNPLTGPQGASAVFGPQKGATPEMVARLDANLGHFASIVQRDLGAAVCDIPGAGAAGGLGAGMIAFCSAQLLRGIDMVIQATGLRDLLANAGLCLTGEGSIDHSSQFGKTAVGVSGVCRELGVPVVALAGSIRPGARATLERGLTAYFDVTLQPQTLPEAMSSTRQSLADVAEQVVRLFMARRRD